MKTSFLDGDDELDDELQSMPPSGNYELKLYIAWQIELKLESMDFWETYHSSFPLLSKLVRHIHSIPAGLELLSTKEELISNQVK